MEISGNSMQPVLDGGDVVLTDRITYVVRRPRRFDIVVFKHGKMEGKM